jgi:hypothetical protein
MNSEHQKQTAEFLTELIAAIKSHKCRRSWDAGLYQSLVIGAASAGFLSLYVGTVYESAKWAGVIGALTSVATILSQQLKRSIGMNGWQLNWTEFGFSWSVNMPLHLTSISLPSFQSNCET